MVATGNLHISDEFRKAKRNLLWFCSFAILLWMATIRADVSIPTMGNEVRIDKHLLQIFVWAACLYMAVEFYRQVRDVNLLSKEAVYDPEFRHFGERLMLLHTSLSDLVSRAANLSHAATQVVFAPSQELELAKEKMLSQVRDSLVRAGDYAERLRNESDAEILRRTQGNWKIAWSNLTRQVEGTIEQAMGELANQSGSNETAIKTLEDIEVKSRVLGEQVGAIKATFDRVSDLIRNDHRRFYTWLDKVFPFAMFVAATAATLADVVPLLNLRFPASH